MESEGKKKEHEQTIFSEAVSFIQEHMAEPLQVV